MPAFCSLGYGKIADVAANIRNAWRNRALSVGSGDVGKLHHAIAVTPRPKSYVEVVVLVEALVAGVIAPVRFSWLRDPANSPIANAPAPTYKAVMAQSISWAFWTPAGFPGANGP
jgi:hypothetical protein